MVFSLSPDYCRTPVGPSFAVVPYSLIAFLDDSGDESPNVRMTGEAALNANSFQSGVIGDEPGVGGGIVSGVSGGRCIPVESTCSGSVLINGSPAVHNGTLMWMNCPPGSKTGNTQGRVQFFVPQVMASISPDGQIMGDTNPPLMPETPEEEGWLARSAPLAKGTWRHTLGFARGVGMGLLEAGEGLLMMAQVASRFTVPGILLDPMGPIKTVQDGWGLAAALRNDPLLIWDSVKEPYVSAAENGEYGEIAGRAALEVASVVFGAKGADKVARGGKVASTAAKGARAAKVGGMAAKGGRAAKVGGMAAKGARSAIAAVKDKMRGITIKGMHKPLPWKGLARKVHKKSGVLLDRRGNPIFKAKHKFKMSKDLRFQTDHKQFKAATMDLKKQLTRKPTLKNLYSPEELMAIEKELPRIPGNTWHHHQDGRTLQLVNRKKHNMIWHKGGKGITGAKR